MSKLGKSLIGAAVGLAMSTSAAFSEEVAKATDYVSNAGSADTCLMTKIMNYNGHAVDMHDVRVDSIRTCFNLGRLHEADQITALRSGKIVAHIGRENRSGSFGSNNQYYDNTPE